MTYAKFRKDQKVDVVLRKVREHYLSCDGDDAKLNRLFDDLVRVEGRIGFPASDIDAYREAFATAGLRVMLVADPSIPLFYEEVA